MVVWADPQEAGTNAGDFVGDVSNWFQDAFDRAEEFSEGVSD